MKVIVVSGFFNPLHGGHLDMIEAAAKLGDRLIVIVNNDTQQVQKKGKVILVETNRARLLRALRVVDEVMISIDEDMTVTHSLAFLASQYPDDELVFANGGDRDSVKTIPESEVCAEHGIELVFGVGSDKSIKRDSSTRINQALGHAK
ncbi:TPA: glycerol-3-phosphate cytidylyltransferase [Candidatus Saccharibacteria bacterium]|nr:glycerol-3-phosphate cytidylyltransferase [Candidatus Saccharibacteria bacterium]